MNKNLIKPNGHFHMQDASSQPVAQVTAKAEGKVFFKSDAEKILIADGKIKESIATAANVSAIQAAKRTSEFIPLHHSNSLNWVDVHFNLKKDHIHIVSTVKAVSRSKLQMEALTAVSVASLTIMDFCKDYESSVSVKEIKIIPEVKEKKMISKNVPLKVGIIVISDRVVAGLSEDEAGQVLKEGFKKAGYHTDDYSIISNNTDKLVEKIQEWLEKNVELIITTGGNGIGPRDITLTSVEPFFDFRMEGVEQTLYSIAQVHNNGFYIDRLAAGKIGKTIVICLPMDPELARDALNVLIPNIYQAFEF